MNINFKESEWKHHGDKRSKLSEKTDTKVWKGESASVNGVSIDDGVVYVTY